MLCEKRSYFKKSVVANREQQQKQPVQTNLIRSRKVRQRHRRILERCDPRLLMFEFSLAIILRQRQVQLTKQFVQSAERGGGECAQMLMGEGKNDRRVSITWIFTRNGYTNGMSGRAARFT